MEKVLHVQSVNDYARYVGAPVLHPLVSVIRYEELERCRHALCEYGVYALFLSPNYFGDLVRAKTGESASLYIRHFLMRRAKGFLLEGRTVSEVSDALGFEYPQNFTRMFKKEYGFAPSRLHRLQP